MRLKIVVYSEYNSLLADIVTMIKESDKNTIVTQFDDKFKLLTYLEKYSIDVVLVDVEEKRNNKNSGNIIQQIKKTSPSVSVIAIANNRTMREAIESMKYGAFDYLAMPIDKKDLESVISKASQTTMLNQKVTFVSDVNKDEDIEMLDDYMIGSSVEMMEIWKIVGKTAETSTTVLIQGDSGTGKELLARAIYNNSTRKDKPFMAVNCAAMNENILESELFGHEKGAFTDAFARRIGKFEQCNKGTLFLDEIGEMSLLNQSKLLRFLENQEFQRVGGNETIKVDVRIIAATNRSLLSSVKQKTFRLDLFYRLKVLSIFLPSLKERAEDISLLAKFFVKKYSNQYSKNITINQETIEFLEKQPWDGNIRELKNVIDSAIVMMNGAKLTVEDISPHLKTVDPYELRQEPLSDKAYKKITTEEDFKLIIAQITNNAFDIYEKAHLGDIYKQMLNVFESSIVTTALNRYSNNQVNSAKKLGISRNTLRNILIETDVN